MRTLAARALADWKDELVRDLGGQDAVSAQRMAIVEMAVRTRLIIEHCDHFILSQETLVNKRKRSLFPIVQDRQRLVDSLGRLLAQLGLDRVARPIVPLAQYIQNSEKTSNDEAKPSPEKLSASSRGPKPSNQTATICDFPETRFRAGDTVNILERRPES